MKETTRVLGVLVSLVAATLLVTAPPAAAVTATTTTLTSSANPSQVGQAVTLTATVVGDAPTGSVTFAEPGFTLGTTPVSGGVATLVVTNWAAGTHAVTAAYSGDPDNDPSMGSLTQTVVAPVDPVEPVEPPKVRLRVSTDKVAVGDKVRLSWRSKRADVVTASGDWAGQQKSHGSALVRLTKRGKHVFRLTVQNASGQETARVKVTATRKSKELELVVTDELVVVGTKVDLTADGLAKDERFVVRLDGKEIMTGKADRRGDVARTFEVSKTTPEGALSLTITGSNPGRVGTAVLNVIKAKSLDVEVDSPELPKKSEQTVMVIGLLPGEAVTVMYAGTKLTTGKADKDGRFTYSFDVGKVSGERTVKVIGAIPTRSGAATFTVTGRPGGGGDDIPS